MAQMKCITLLVLLIIGAAKAEWETAEPDCTYYETGMYGNLYKPSYFSPNSVCTWHIVPDGELVKSTGEVFLVIKELVLSENDSLTLYDGAKDNQQIFPEFSRFHEPFSILTGTLNLTIVLKTSSDEFPVKRRFWGSFDAQSRDHKITVADGGTFTTPLYLPENKKIETNTILSSNLGRFRVVFEDFQLSNESTLTITGTDNDMDGDYQVAPKTELTSVDTITLQLSLDKNQPGQQIQIFYEVINAKHNCGGDYKVVAADLGRIVMGKSQECIWNITAPADKNNSNEILLVFKEFNLGPNDQMIIYEGRIEDKNILFDKIDGYQDPFTILTGVRDLTIFLEMSDSDRPLQRYFSAYYTATPELAIKPLAVESGSLTSPLYNPRNKTLELTLQLEPKQIPAHKLLYTFSEFSLPEGELEISRMENGNGKYSGNKVPPEMMSGQAAELKLTLDLSVRDQKFTVRYEPVIAECSESVPLTSNHPTFPIKPPNMRDITTSSANGLRCLWIFTTDVGNTIGFDLRKLAFGSPLDEFVVNDGPSRLSENLVKVDAQNLQLYSDRYVRTSGKVAWVSFSLFELSNSGTVNFEVDVSLHTQGGFYKDHGTVTRKANVPEDPEQVYLLEVPQEQQAYLHFSKLSMSKGSKLEVYDNFYRNSQPIITFNSPKEATEVAASGNQLMIIPRNFKKQDTFVAEFRGVPFGCYHVSRGKTGMYDADKVETSCSWIISPVNVESKEIIDLRISHMDLQFDDQIKIETLSPRKLLTTITATNGVNHISPVYMKASEGVRLEVVRGKESTKQKRQPTLRATYTITPGCSSTFHLKPQESGIEVKSPNSPDSYALNAECEYRLETDSDSLIYISFADVLDLAKYDYLIVAGLNTSLVLDANSEPPNDLIVRGNVVVQFSSEIRDNKYFGGKGFTFRATAFSCGGYLNETEGVFSTPDFPDAVSENLTVCAWIVDVPPRNDNVSVNIIQFSINEGNSSSEETTSRLFVYNGGSVRSPLLQNITSRVMLSDYNSLVFVYAAFNNTGKLGGVEVSYASHVCTSLCDNGKCMHDDWHCDGLNQCGDYSDEKNCHVGPSTTTSPPTKPTTVTPTGTEPTGTATHTGTEPTGTATHTGTGPTGTEPHTPTGTTEHTEPTPSSCPNPEQQSVTGYKVALGVLIPLFFILGILVAIFAPMVYRKVRSGDYTEFRDNTNP